jgi:nucleoside-diphosphate-sugar epimerase
MSAPASVGVLGATSLVGEYLLPQLLGKGWRVVAFSRRKPSARDAAVEWRQLTPAGPPSGYGPAAGEEIAYWVCLAPIWVLPEHFAMLERHAARRVVALSSTSRFTKGKSSEPLEQGLAQQIAAGEDQFVAWAQEHGIEWTILRPTMIYGLGRDRNISEIARFIRRFGFFPVLGRASGLRQPVHAEDVAAACLSALEVPDGANRDFNLSGGETLSYREMVCRIFAATGKSGRLIAVPFWVIRFALSCLHLLCRCTPLRRFSPARSHVCRWSAAIAERMNQDLVFDHRDAASALGFSPRGFHPNAGDLPR